MFSQEMKSEIDQMAEMFWFNPWTPKDWEMNVPKEGQCFK